MPGGITSVVQAIVMALLGRTRTARLRAQIEFHLGVFAKLEPGNAVRVEVDAHLGRLARALIEIEKARLQRTRDWGEVIVGVGLSALCGYGVWKFAVWGGWWRIPAAVLALLAIGVLANIIQELRGHPPEPAPSGTAT